MASTVEGVNAAPGTSNNSVISAAVVAAVVRRPSLWLTAIRQIGILAPRRWWTRAPFLPIAPKNYIEFRLVTQYGGGHGEPQDDIRPVDVVDYLRWCKQWNSDFS